MLRDALNFFRKERVYALLFVLVGLLILWAQLKTQSTYQMSETSPAFERFREAETRLEEKVKNAGSLEKFLQSRPQLERVFNLFTLFILSIFAMGVVLCICWIFLPSWRMSFEIFWPADKTPWKLSMIFKVILLFILGSFTIGFFLSGLRVLTGPNIPDNFYVLLHTTMADLLCVGLILWIVKQAQGDWRELGLRVPSQGPIHEVFVAWTGYLGILVPFVFTLVLLMALASLFHYEPPPHPLVHVFLEEEAKSPFLIGYSVFLAVVVGPILEEIFFRGFCYRILKARWGIRVAIVLSALFFALIHENSFAFLPIFVLGLGLAYVYELRGSLLPSIVIHITHNALFISYFFLAKQIVFQEGS